MSLSSSHQFVIISIDYSDQNNQIVCETVVEKEA